MSAARQALLILTPERSAVFSATAATERVNKTLAAPTGAAMLAWAAARYKDFGDQAFAIFHSGNARFSNAVPLTRPGHPA